MADDDGLLSFERDANTMIVGPTSSGKTTLLKQILSAGQWTGGVPERLVIVGPIESLKSWIEPEWTKPSWAREVIRVEGEPAFASFLDQSDQIPENTVMVFDDVGGWLEQKDLRVKFEKLFRVVTHHRHCWTFLLLHELFSSGSVAMRRNAQNFILFDVLQDQNATNAFLGRLIGQSRIPLFMAMFQDALQLIPGHGWIRLDLRRGAEYNRVVSTKGFSWATGAELYLVGTSAESAEGAVPSLDGRAATASSGTHPAGGVRASDLHLDAESGTIPGQHDQ